MKTFRACLAFSLGMLSGPAVLLVMFVGGAIRWLWKGDYVDAIEWMGRVEDEWTAPLRRIRG